LSDKVYTPSLRRSEGRRESGTEGLFNPRRKQNLYATLNEQ